MKLSTRGRYGIHTMYDLALNGENGPQSIKAIAERGGMPEAYLEQLIAGLKRAGLVTSTRGAQGGYMLARPAEEITVGDVLRALFEFQSRGAISPPQAYPGSLCRTLLVSILLYEQPRQI